MIYIFTDGSCSGNGKENPLGGYGVVAVDAQDNILYENSKPIEMDGTATNNRAELWAIVDALQWIEQQGRSPIRLPLTFKLSDWKFSPPS